MKNWANKERSLTEVTGLSAEVTTINLRSWRRRRRVKAVLWCVIAFADTWVRYNRLCVPVRRIHNSCYLERRCYDVWFWLPIQQFWSSRSFHWAGRGHGKRESFRATRSNVMAMAEEIKPFSACYLPLKLSARCDWCRVSGRSGIASLFRSPFLMQVEEQCVPLPGNASARDAPSVSVPGRWGER